MARKKQKQAKKGRSPAAANSAAYNPGSGAAVYRGPSRLLSRAPELETFQFRDFIHVNATASSNVGTYAVVVTADTVTTAHPDWAETANLFQEYRVLAVEVEYLPTKPGALVQANGSNNQANGLDFSRAVTPFFLCAYHDDPTALGSGVAAAGHHDSKVGTFFQRMRKTSRMSETQEGLWTDTTAALSANFGIKTYGSWETLGSTDHVHFGVLLRTWTVQFKGRVYASNQVRREAIDALRRRLSAPGQQQLSEERKEVPPPSPLVREQYVLVPAAAAATPSAAGGFSFFSPSAQQQVKR